MGQKYSKMQTLYNRPKHLNKEVAENVTDE